MKQCYKVYASKRDKPINIIADDYELDENILGFFNKGDKYITETVAVFNINNILGFEKIKVGG